MSDKPVEDVDNEFFKNVAFPLLVVGVAYAIIQLFKYLAA